MKKEIHPKYHPDAQIICACGNVIKTGSTVKEMRVEICSSCHPFYTGKKKLLDTTGRVERFKKISGKAAEKKTSAKQKKERVKKEKAPKAEIKKTVSKKKK